jgi:hypothetical protein
VVNIKVPRMSFAYKKAFAKTIDFTIDLNKECTDLPVYGTLSTDGYGALTLSILYSDHLGLVPSLRKVALRDYNVDENEIDDDDESDDPVKQNPLIITNNSNCVYAVLTCSTSQKLLQKGTECIVNMKKGGVIVRKMIQLGSL